MLLENGRSEFGVLVVAYKRPQQLAQLLTSLSGDHFFESEKNVIVSVDGPKDTSALNLKTHSAVLEIANEYKSRNIVSDIISPERNLGTAGNMVKSINYAFQFFEYVLVIEDDLVLSADIQNISEISKRYINKYNSALSIYSNLTKNRKPFLSNRFNSQGWVTHRDYWTDFDIDYLRSYVLTDGQKEKIHRKLGSDIIRDFSLFQKGKIDTWAVPWNIYNFLNNRSMIYLNKSYITNNSHLMGAERTQNIAYRYEIADVKLSDLDFENLKLDPSYIKHYSYYNRLIRRLGAYAKKYL